MFLTKHLLCRWLNTTGVRHSALTTTAAGCPIVTRPLTGALRWSSSQQQQQQQQKSPSSNTVDGQTSASVVVADPARAAEERDRIARAVLSGNLSHPNMDERTVVTLKGLEHTVPYTLSLAAESASAARKLEEEAGVILRNAFEMVDRHLNNFNPESEVSLVNTLPVNVAHKMSVHLQRVMECCVRVHQSSGGCFDPATAPLVKQLRQAILEEHGSTFLTLAEDEIELFSLPRSFDLNLAEGTIARRHTDANLDLGGVNKGYTLDYVVEQLNTAGIIDAMFEWGGDCRASGLNCRRNPWVVAIARPPSVEEIINRANLGCTKVKTAVENESAQLAEISTSSLLHVMHLDNEALCTSGDYENLLRSHQNKFYTSIYDWKTKALLSPSQCDLAQVSVKCYSAMYADALATAALVKRDPVKVRYMLEGWRYVRDTVKDYTAYTRENERVARMHEIATENSEMRKNRIGGSLPARVVVVGGGLAGQSAAIEAANCGAQVILLEKEAKLGGNSAKATSGINGWGSRAQAKANIQDSGKYFERDTFKSGVGGNTDPGLVKTLSVKSADAIRWLTSLGVPLSVLSQLGGHSHKRTHRAPDRPDGTPVPIGFTIMQTLEGHIRTNLAERVTVMTGVSVTSLLHEKKERPDGTPQVRVTGVEVTQADGEKSKIMADAVILATGGFSNDKTADSLLTKYAPQLAGFPTTNGPWATGDGVRLASKLGAKLVDMDKVQLHPTGLIDPKDPGNPTKYLGPEALRGSGGVLLNKNGERFIDELQLRSVVSNAIIAQGNEYPGSNGSRFAYCILNEAARNLFGVNSHGFYWNKLGLFVKVDTVEDLAKLIQCPVENVRKTLEEYGELSTAQRTCQKTHKSVYPCVVGPQGPFYVAFVTPSIHYTMGGCLISPSAEVQMECPESRSSFGRRRPILGLFGAGEVTGGVHGRNRLGGNSLLECVVFGKIAGDRAATILQKKSTPLSFTTWTTVVLREVREGGLYGVGSRVLRFNLPGALQRSGLSLGQFIAIRGEWDGQQLIGYYSPITLPDDLGVVGILARSDKGTLKEWISALQPGDAVEMKGCGGLVIERRYDERHLHFAGHVIKKLSLIAGGTGVAPMLQIIRAALKKPFNETVESIHLIYAAEDVSELTYRTILEEHERESKGKFRITFVLNHPPPMWTDGIGFIDKNILRSNVQQPADDLLVAICGPPVMQRVVKSCLKALGYNMHLVRTVDEVDPQPSSKM